MRSLSTSLLAASTALAVSFGGVVAQADTVAPEDTPSVSNEYADRGAITNGIHSLQAIGIFATEGTGTMPRAQETASFVAVPSATSA